MAKALMLEFATANGTKTQMTLDDDLVKQDLQGDAVRTIMEEMLAASVSATAKGEAYATAVSASYIERTESVLFDDAAPSL